MRVVLAVDGGNSKTDLALVATTARCSRTCAGRSARRTTSASTAASTCCSGSSTRQGSTDDGRDVAQVLLAGVDFPDEEEALHDALAARGWAATTRVGNDTFAVLRAGTERGWGVAIMCGAGHQLRRRRARRPAGPLPRARCDHRRLGRRLRRRHGRRSRPPRAARTAAARARASSSSCRRTSATTSPATSPHAIHLGAIPQRRVLELAPVVLRAAADDAVAAGIVDRLVDEIVAFVRATR